MCFKDNKTNKRPPDEVVVINPKNPNHDLRGHFSPYNNAPTKYNNPEELSQKLNEYFNNCVELDKFPTICGLTLFLGYNDKYQLSQACETYDEPLAGMLKKAITRIEQFHEKNLGTKAACAGSIFWLKNRGWRDTPEVNVLTDDTMVHLLDKIRPTQGLLPGQEDKPK